MLWLRIEAPFATFRTFTAGWYRPTATFLTPSAAYGLVMNFAGIETRLREGEDGHNGKTPASLTAKGLPSLKLAIGAAGEDRRGQTIPFEEAFPRVQTTYQQLHNYPVGKGNKVDDPDAPGEKAYQGDIAARRAQGNKSNITPVRREFLSDLRAVIGIDAEIAVLDRVRRGLAGEFPRYGVPFLGDNNFLLDRVELFNAPKPAYWFVPVAGAGGGPRPRTVRLTIAIDRADLSRTTSQLFAPEAEANATPPVESWTPFAGT
ncbi:type I-MYXAN CRISPR-associated protein Cas5/Cmx5/DevS [Gemmata sp. JC673]|uniref:Type I-MYXAN CRISPR-associated protein Cas5/Cmx5/DevS n=1 Tax=Gemmata algarum TaxID=2975278 RepID=A0ABU5F631_9BACT|nr:type I-MYXAN CRISPR-associated protein Cas5/Cmx5/DevS [Gemmata algarum]MDY3562200.1 type I-MYXAN CRISPR-associated protein Cas5/Cmx5/DevS [Gemmata algarum]